MNKGLKNLRLWKKFSLLALLALVLAGVPAAFYATNAMRTVERARLEAAGVPHIHAVMKVVQLMQQHRGLSAMFLGASVAQTERESKQAEVDAAMQAADAVLSGGGHDKPIVQAWRDARGAWAGLAPGVAARGINAADSFARHTEIVKVLAGLIDLLGDHHGLWLDHERDSNALITASLQVLPRVAEELGQARAKGSMYLSRLEASTKERIELGALITKAGEDLEAAEAHLTKAFAASPALRNALDAPLKSLVSSTRAAFTLAGEQVVRPEVLSGSGTEFFATYTRVIDQAFDFSSAAIVELGKLLDARERRVMTEELAMLAGMITVFALVALLAHAVVRSITGPAADAVRLANALACGELGERVYCDARDEMGEMLSALDTMRESLVEAIQSIRASADSVGSASQQIAAGNLDLSSRTDEQASTLEETASSMEELTVTVKQNADSARKANQLAIGASRVVDQGGQAMGDVVSTMNGIADSSKRIGDIVGVIDGIAFQTNLLALNAAVEAARAGEQGRGFAVVAGEVRALAQRSAAAAKEIRQLIETSVERVKDGTQLVEGAGATMEKILVSVRQVTDIMSEIAAASEEQLRGIEQVNLAVMQMDQATQQNAALVEESSAAAEEMANQAGDLVRAVAHFKTRSGENGLATRGAVAAMLDETALARPEKHDPRGRTAHWPMHHGEQSALPNQFAHAAAT